MMFIFLSDRSKRTLQYAVLKHSLWLINFKYHAMNTYGVLRYSSTISDLGPSHFNPEEKASGTN
jgi:hypothetical protein